MAEKGSKRSTAKKLLTTVLVVAVLVLSAGAGVWYLWQQDVGQLKQEIANLEGRIQTLRDGGQANNQDGDQPRPDTAVKPADYTYTSDKGVKVEVYQPQKDSQLSSPVKVVGQVPGSWSFEANFPVELLDSEGNVVARTPAQIQGDWMTEELVVFTAELKFSGAKSGPGQLVLRKANPSGLAENDDQVTIPVQLK